MEASRNTSLMLLLPPFHASPSSLQTRKRKDSSMLRATRAAALVAATDEGVEIDPRARKAGRKKLLSEQETDEVIDMAAANKHLAVIDLVPKNRRLHAHMHAGAATTKDARRTDTSTRTRFASSSTSVPSLQLQPTSACLPAASATPSSRLRVFCNLSSMSAIVNETASIIVPSTPTPGVATVPSFNAAISPKAFSVEARLDLPLDDLIKERKKEIKKEKKHEKKHESVKKETTQLQSQKKNQKQLKKSDSTTKNVQSVKRNALVSKNRGLPALPAASNPSGSNGNGVSTSKNAKKKKKPAPKTVVGKKAAAASKQIAAATQQQKSKQNKKSAANANGKKNAGQNNASPKATVPQTQQQKKRKQKAQQVQVIQQQQQQQPKKKAQQPQQQQLPKSNKAHANKNGNGGSVKTLTVVTKEQARKVVRSSNSKAANIRITIKQAPSVSTKSQNKKTKNKNNKQQPKKTAIMNVVLPGKVACNFSNSQAARAQKVVKRVQNRKQSSSKNGAFVVRKPFVSRKN